jgi:hypothetical protein
LTFLGLKVSERATEHNTTRTRANAIPFAIVVSKAITNLIVSVSLTLPLALLAVKFSCVLIFKNCKAIYHHNLPALFCSININVCNSAIIFFFFNKRLI